MHYKSVRSGTIFTLQYLRTRIPQLLTGKAKLTIRCAQALN